MKLKRIFVGCVSFFIIASASITPVLAATDSVDINVESDILATD